MTGVSSFRHPYYSAEAGMALLYENFGVRRFELTAHMWPDIEGFTTRELRRLFGTLSIGVDDDFDSCVLRGDEGARFEGEHWVYDISSGSILLQCLGYSSSTNLRGSIHELLEQTRSFFAARQRLAFFVYAIRVFGTVPDDKDRHVGDVVRKRLLRQTDTSELPGLAGAGLSLVGDADEGFHWHARIEPPHGAYDVLGIATELMFDLPPDPPTEDNDLDAIDEQVETAHSFIANVVPAFASKLFK
jgi:hypothetical protein